MNKSTYLKLIVGQVVYLNSDPTTKMTIDDIIILNGVEYSDLSVTWLDKKGKPRMMELPEICFTPVI